MKHWYLFLFLVSSQALSAESPIVLNKLPLSHAIVAAEEILQKKPSESAWKTLYDASEMPDAQRLLQSFFKTLEETNASAVESPPFFATDANFYLASIREEAKDLPGATAHYKNVKISDRHFVNARHAMARILFAQGKSQEAIQTIQSLFYKEIREFLTIEPSRLARLDDQLYLMLARIYYQEKNYRHAISYYRKVSKEGQFFYQALFEQAWALFMGGYPQFALGVVYSSESPFFKNKFNPEAKILESIASYWLCQYDAAKYYAEEFNQFYLPKYAGLKEFVSDNGKDPTFAATYDLFERYISKSNLSQLAVSEDIIADVLSRPILMGLRAEFASYQEELTALNKNRAEAPKSFGPSHQVILEQLARETRLDIAKQTFSELNELKLSFDKLTSQLQFLNVEILMGAKEQIMGSELHASLKQLNIKPTQEKPDTGKNPLSWAPDLKGEYWWDEIGFHVSTLSNQCRSN
jgi:tetratricopeptide (TPR) repeat protein